MLPRITTVPPGWSATANLGVVPHPPNCCMIPCCCRCSAPHVYVQLAKRVLEDFPSPYHTLTEGGHTPGEGADFLLGEVTETVTRVRTEQGLLTYLSCLKALGGAPHLRSLKAITRLRLQSELYSLTSPGERACVRVCVDGVECGCGRDVCVCLRWNVDVHVICVWRQRALQPQHSYSQHRLGLVWVPRPLPMPPLTLVCLLLWLLLAAVLCLAYMRMLLLRLLCTHRWSLLPPQVCPLSCPGGAGLTLPHGAAQQAVGAAGVQAAAPSRVPGRRVFLAPAARTAVDMVQRQAVQHSRHGAAGCAEVPGPGQAQDTVGAQPRPAPQQ